MCNNGPAWLWLYTQYNIYMHHASLCCIVRRLSAAFCMIRLEEAYIHSTSNTKKRYSYTHCLCESFAPHASLHLMRTILTPLTTGVILVRHQTRTVAPRGSIHTPQVMTAFNWLLLKGYDRGMRTVCLKPHTMRSTPGTIVLLWWPETMVMLYIIATSGTKCCTWLHTCEQINGTSCTTGQEVYTVYTTGMVQKGATHTSSRWPQKPCTLNRWGQLWRNQ